MNGEHECSEATEATEETYRPQKRRSLALQRRSALSTTEGSKERVSNQNDTCKEQEDSSLPDSEFNLEAYVERLRKERKSWVATVHKQKSERRRLGKELASVQQNPQDLDLSVLLESERKFLASSLDYEKICKQSKSLGDIAVKTVMLNQRLRRLNAKFMSKLECNIRIQKNKIISMVD